MQTENVTPEWENWLHQNLENQCDTRELRQIMREHGFSDTLIRQMMAQSPSETAEAKSAPAPTGPDHQQLALAPLGANNPSLHVQRLNSMQIQLYTIDNFMSAEECEHLIDISSRYLRPSEVTHHNGDDEFRTSTTCDFLQIDHPFVDEIDEKISLTLGIRLGYSEPIQVQRYEVGQEFKAHHDYFAPNTDIYSKFADGSGNRTWTFMVYLNTTAQGGGTHFTEINQTFFPEQGTAVVWNNLLADGSPNPMTKHHGMPVEEGNKIIITKWFRENGDGPMFYVD